MKRVSTQFEQRCWRRGWRWSTGLHGCCVGLVVAQLLWLPLPTMPAGSQPLLVVQQAVVADAPELIVEMAGDDRSWIAREAERFDFQPLDVNDPAWQAIVEEPFHSATEPTHEGPALLEREIERSIAATSRRSDLQNWEELGQLSQRLSQVSSEKTVEEMNGTLNRLLGTGERATAPQEKAPAGPFDFTSAQVFDVRKEEQADGSVKYIAVMLDAAGRTIDVELDDAGGERAFRTMQIVKANPLLEQVYRGAVMGLIDKMLSGAK